MAISASTCSPALLSSKSSHAFSFPRSDPHPIFPKFDRCSFPTSRQNHPSSLSTNASLLRAKACENTRQPMLPPYNVLITGSTKGIGFALAKEFLKAGDNVVICSRSAERVESAVQSLREDFAEQQVWGTKCDVREGKDVKDLVAFAQKNLKYIDIWTKEFGSWSLRVYFMQVLKAPLG